LRCDDRRSVKVILDTDIGSDIDDAVCLAYLLASPAVDLLGITTVSGQPQQRAALADAVCRAAGVTDVLIHAGTADALLGPTPQPEVPQAAVLDRFAHRSAEAFAPNTAVEFLREQILAAPGEVTLLTVGPMTNVALLFATYPHVASALGALVSMAGVYSNRTPGAGPVEWNVYCDPHAAAAVYRTRVASHRLVGLDVTMRCVMPSADAIARFTKIGGALEVVTAATEVWASERDRVVFHDPLASVALVDTDVCTWRDGRVHVELASRRLCGATMFERDAEGPHTVGWDVDSDRFFAAYFSVFD